MSMSLNRKLVLLFAGLMAGVLAMVVLVILFAFRSYSVASSTAHVKTAAEMVRVHLTESMIQGTIHDRAQFLKRLEEVDGLLSARVIRSHHVNDQYGGSGLDEMPADNLDRMVLADGRERFVVNDEWGAAVFRGTIPFPATSSGSPNCMQCHQVPEGTVLGAVTLEVSISELKNQALITVATIALVLAAFSVLAILALKRLIRPVGETAHAVEVAVTRAMAGDFKGRLESRTNDDIGKIALQMNSLMDFLDGGLSRINQRAAQLTQRQPRQDENQLEVTIDLVNGLADAASFKQAIEEDEHKAEIYDRFGRILSERLGLSHYSIYETDGQKQLIPIMVDGVPQGACKWCDEQILARNDLCRAKRTGHAVDGLTHPGICYAFQPPSGETAGYRHYCLPVMQQGGVGSIIQLVTDAEDAARLEEQIPYVRVFAREMAPVLEAKRLTETLRESALRDPMTGLNNRRYLEEYVDTLISAARRRKSSMALLLLDLDYFKVVNDTYGHDAGDTVLKSLATTLRNSVRASDMVIRFGGEEFLIVLQDTEAGGAAQVSENIRAAVEALKINIGSEILQKTISIGFAMFPEDSETFWQIVKFADVALYRAKHDGRNRVVRFNREMWEEGNTNY